MGAGGSRSVHGPTYSSVVIEIKKREASKIAEEPDDRDKAEEE